MRKETNRVPKFLNIFEKAENLLQACGCSLPEEAFALDTHRVKILVDEFRSAYHKSVEDHWEPSGLDRRVEIQIDLSSVANDEYGNVLLSYMDELLQLIDEKTIVHSNKEFFALCDTVMMSWSGGVRCVTQMMNNNSHCIHPTSQSEGTSVLAEMGFMMANFFEGSPFLERKTIVPLIAAKGGRPIYSPMTKNLKNIIDACCIVSGVDAFAEFVKLLGITSSDGSLLSQTLPHLIVWNSRTDSVKLSLQTDSYDICPLCFTITEKKCKEWFYRLHPCILDRATNSIPASLDIRDSEIANQVRALVDTFKGKQRIFVEQITTTSNNLIVVGPGGTGKTAAALCGIIILYANILKCGQVLVVAYRKSAASAYGSIGCTFHNLFALRKQDKCNGDSNAASADDDDDIADYDIFLQLNSLTKDNVDVHYSDLCKNQKKMDRLLTLTVLFVDEAFQFAASLFQWLDGILKKIKCNKKPFGGLRMILVGDPLQNGTASPMAQLLWFTKVISACTSPFYPLSLDAVHRQSLEDDRVFLNSIRLGICGTEDIPDKFIQWYNNDRFNTTKNCDVPIEDVDLAFQSCIQSTDLDDLQSYVSLSKSKVTVDVKTDSLAQKSRLSQGFIKKSLQSAKVRLSKSHGPAQAPCIIVVTELLEAKKGNALAELLHAKRTDIFEKEDLISEKFFQNKWISSSVQAGIIQMKQNFQCKEDFPKSLFIPKDRDHSNNTVFVLMMDIQPPYFIRGQLVTAYWKRDSNGSKTLMILSQTMARKDLIREPMELKPLTCTWIFQGITYIAKAYPMKLAKFMNVGKVIGLTLNHLRVVYQNQLNTSHFNGNLYTLLSRADLEHSYVCFPIHENDVKVNSQILVFIQYIKDHELQPLQGIFNQETLAFERTEVYDKQFICDGDEEDSIVTNKKELYAGSPVYDYLQRDPSLINTFELASYRTDPQLASLVYLDTKNQKEVCHECVDVAGGFDSSFLAMSNTNSQRQMKSSSGAGENSKTSKDVSPPVDMSIVRFHKEDLEKLYSKRRKCLTGAKFVWDGSSVKLLVTLILSCKEQNATQSSVIEHVFDSLRTDTEDLKLLENAKMIIKSKVRNLWEMISSSCQDHACSKTHVVDTCSDNESSVVQEKKQFLNDISTICVNRDASNRDAGSQKQATLHTAQNITPEFIIIEESNFHLKKGTFVTKSRKKNPVRRPWEKDAFMGLLCALKNNKGSVVKANFTNSLVSNITQGQDRAISRVNRKFNDLKSLHCTDAQCIEEHYEVPSDKDEQRSLIQKLHESLIYRPQKGRSKPKDSSHKQLDLSPPDHNSVYSSEAESSESNSSSGSVGSSMASQERFSVQSSPFLKRSRVNSQQSLRNLHLAADDEDQFIDSSDEDSLVKQNMEVQKKWNNSYKDETHVSPPSKRHSPESGRDPPAFPLLSVCTGVSYWNSETKNRPMGTYPQKKSHKESSFKQSQSVQHIISQPLSLDGSSTTFPLPATSHSPPQVAPNSSLIEQRINLGQDSIPSNKLSDDDVVCVSETKGVSERESAVVIEKVKSLTILNSKADSKNPNSSLIEQRASLPDIDKSALVIQHIALRMKILDKTEVSRFKAVLKRPSSEGSAEVIERYNINMTVKKISCLADGTWLNDEVVNFYMSMLQFRSNNIVATANMAHTENRRSSHYFSSFFISMLLEKKEYKYQHVSKWTKSFDIFEQDKIFFPVNIDNKHWTLMVAYMQRKQLHYYDSLNGSGESYLDAAMKWIIDEGKEKKKITVDRSEWMLIDYYHDHSKMETVLRSSGHGHFFNQMYLSSSGEPVDPGNYVPQQHNGFDCGMFCCINADFVSDDLPLLNAFSQANIKYFRRKVGTDILRGTINY